jgi:hypothetical protein
MDSFLLLIPILLVKDVEEEKNVNGERRIENLRECEDMRSSVSAEEASVMEFCDVATK